MPPTDALVLQFASSRPQEMATVLSNADVSELCELLRELPPGVGASVAAHLASWQLTTLLGTLEPALIADLLIAARTDEAISLVSHLHTSRYPAVLDAAPKRSHPDLRELFNFPANSVAAFATTEFIRVSGTTLCGDFAEQLANSTDNQPRPVLVADAQGRYLGRLNLQAVYARKNRSRPAADFALAVSPLNGLTRVESALTARQWLNHSELPVVDARHRLLGIVTRAALERASGSTTGREYNLERLLTELAGGYLNACASVVESVLGKSR